MVIAIGIFWFLLSLNDTLEKRSADQVKISEANRDAEKHALDRAKVELDRARIQKSD